MNYLFCLFICFCRIAFALEPILVVNGPPGSGKGTFSQFIKEHYSYGHVSAGDLVRSEIDRQTPLGKEIEEIVRRGDYIDQNVMHELMREKVVEFVQNDTAFIIDGFVREKENLQFLISLLRDLEILDQTLFVFLEAENEVCADRILTRMVCPDCGHVYNRLSCPPLQEGICDICSASVKVRLNDSHPVIIKRLNFYREHIEQVLAPSLKSFPSISFNTQLPLDECLKNYQSFMDRLLPFSSTIDQFINATGE